MSGDYAEPLGGVYPFNCPSQSIILHSGGATLDGIALGAVKVELSMRRGLTLRWSAEHSAEHLELGPARLTLHHAALGPVDLPVDVLNSDGWGITAATSLGREEALQRVVIHWVNLPFIWPAKPLGIDKRSWIGRWSVESSGWSHTLDSRPDHRQVMADAIRDDAPYVVTHVAELARSNGLPFTGSQAIEVLYAWQIALSFALGRFVAPALPVGFNEQGQRVWEFWAPWRCDTLTGYQGWWDNHTADDLAGFVDNYLTQYLNSEGHELVRWMAMHLITANHAGTTSEGKVMLAQAGLEYFAWVTLVLHGVMTRTAYKSLNAAERLRHVLKQAGIAPTVPGDLDALRTLADERELDGPGALAWVRNRLTHPKDAGEPYRLEALVWQAAQLLMEYGELALLHHLNYSGTFMRRYPPGRWKHARETVPWASQHRGAKPRPRPNLPHEPIRSSLGSVTERRRLEVVFKTVGLPPYTYVKPAHFGEVKADILQSGRHLLIEGPSGIGKTCVVYKVFEELRYEPDDAYRYASCRDANAEDVIAAFLKQAAEGHMPQPSILVIDDFHLLTKERRGEVGSALKRMSDRAFEHANPPKVILIGIPTAGQSLLKDALDLGPRLGTYRFVRAADSEIDRLISEGEVALNVLFEDRDVLLSESSGNFWLAQYVCNKVCAMQDVHESTDEVRILTFDLLSIRQRLMTELTERYLPIARTFAKGKKWRPGGNKPYLEILLALAKLPDSVVSFDKILQLVPERRRPGIKAVRGRIHEVIHNEAKGIDLRKQLAFDSDSGFSIEDPLFRYFLSNLNAEDLLADLGIELDQLERSKLYAYDVGFSFAGETRQVVEAVNQELKAEDVITFYDFDHQAVMLALDLEQFLFKVYSESCALYLVFLDRHYVEKVWTKFEKDVMVQSGRRGHIIPVLLEEVPTVGVVGVASTLGRIDLREQWAAVMASGSIGPDDRNAIRNRCVLPILEKLSAVGP